MTVRDVLNLTDHDVWVRVRVRGGGEKGPSKDLVLWSADWHGGGEDDPGMPDGLGTVLDWDADDLSIETHVNPEFRSLFGYGVPDREDFVQMIVVNAYPSTEAIAP